MTKNFRDISSFDRDLRLYKYKNDGRVEDVLDRFNQLVVPIEDEISSSCIPRSKQTIFITGAPRSGTTYLYQLMAATLNVGYVSNLMARFYGSPLFGAWLHNQLISAELSELKDFESTHGVTNRIYEPHEFGYFWASYFPFINDNHEELEEKSFNSSLCKLEEKLRRIAGIFNKPVVYKCMIAPFVLDNILENTSAFIVHLKRNPDDVVKSILKVRKERLGDVQRWWSIRPASWKNLESLEPEMQVKRQVELVTKAIDSSRSRYPGRILEIEYEQLQSDRDATLSLIMKDYDRYAGYSE